MYKYFVPLAALCLITVSTKSVEPHNFQYALQFPEKEVNFTITIMQDNLPIIGITEAVRVLKEALSQDITNIQEIGWPFIEQYEYLGPECIWSLVINPNTVFLNPANGKTGYIYFRIWKITSLITEEVYFYAYSSPKNGVTCIIP